MPKIHCCLSDAPHELKVAAIEFVAVLLETSALYRLAVLEGDVIGAVIAAVDSVNAGLAVQIVRGMERMFAPLGNERREAFLSNIAGVIDACALDADEQLVHALQALRACFPEIVLEPQPLN
jgi:hypothetical protein